jgi:hypothetical protein
MRRLDKEMKAYSIETLYTVNSPNVNIPNWDSASFDVLGFDESWLMVRQCNGYGPIHYFNRSHIVSFQIKESDQ